MLEPSGRRTYGRAAVVVLLAYALNTAIKYVVRRARPQLDDLPPLVPTVSSLSYPSAHAATSVAAARALGASPPLVVLATAMCLSRPYAGVHYPSDVLAGAALGGAVEVLTP